MTENEIEYWYVRFRNRNGSEFTAMTTPMDKYADKATECWKFDHLDEAELWVMCDMAMSRLIRARNPNEKGRPIYVNIDDITRVFFVPFKKRRETEE